MASITGSSLKLTPLHVIGLGVGILLAYSAIKDRNPLEVIKTTLTGQPLPEAGSWAPAGYGQVFAPSVTPDATLISNMGQIGAVWPTSSHRLGPKFGEAGSAWSSGYHDGLDIDGSCGDAVWSPVAGQVRSAGYAGAYGNRVVIRSFQSRSLEFWLCHLAHISVRPGATVAQRTKIGTMGQTGNAYGCHLHFMAVTGNRKVDPLPYLTGGSKNA